MSFNSLRYCLRQTFVSLRRNLSLAVVSAAIITVSLIILGGFLLTAVNINHFIRNLENTVEISVFLQDGADIQAIEEKLVGLPEVQGYLFISRHEGLEGFSQQMGGDFLRGLEGAYNPLPDMFRVNVKEAALVPVLASQIETHPGVEKARYGGELISRLVRTSRWVNIGLLSISVLLALAAIFLITTSIRLSVLARQKEIGIMKYLGASNWFVRFPFLLEGMLIGWMGTCTAVIVIGLGYYYAAIALQRAALIFFLQPVTDLQIILPVLGGLLLLGTLLGGIGSLISVRRFLRV